jgi:hypothetical protein
MWEGAFGPFHIIMPSGAIGVFYLFLAQIPNKLF